ncbi:YdeI/OmpD-associated family protein [Urechidicola vernalis]|uniref:YdeI/OmpD-associated family protein n=1 Tax=Urechidicola vernalis TaxID=3075600 RepID=A0ABU2Y543_9FLAO|nr:YdeI/OmpD-associated family protein [Urechidicola sp. P050]MDT0553314.1 YdeI/OmpD-associated family protein [Urechidicola sp. P050]
MKGFTSVEEYIENHSEWLQELEFLRELTFKTTFEETVKWGAPTYTVNGKNVMGIGAFKSYVGLWFFNGSFLTDKENKLINAQDGKTKGMRQWRFNSIKEMDPNLILSYMNEAIENQKEGKTIKVAKPKKEVLIPVELKAALDSDQKLKDAFEKFTPSKQREFTEHISSAKREATKQSRIEKIVPMILQGIGLHDKYRK